MTDQDCVEFLQDCLPRLGLHWLGYRKVRRIVCKRVRRRMRALSLTDYAGYRQYLDAASDEWDRLAEMCRIPVSRFYRDKAVFDALQQQFLPALAKTVLDRRGARLSAWSAGCASGEEPYTIAIMWMLELTMRFPGVSLRLQATDAEPRMIARAKRGCYGKSSLRDVPLDWIPEAFTRDGDMFCLRPAFRDAVRFAVGDMLDDPPDGPFDLVLCRNLAFTYFSAERQKVAFGILYERLRPGGVLVIGSHETLPESSGKLRRISGLPIFEKSVIPCIENEGRAPSPNRWTKDLSGTGDSPVVKPFT